jgi:hypothetical protein
LISELMIAEGNKQKGQDHWRSCPSKSLFQKAIFREGK